jgi:hypothetical protein
VKKVNRILYGDLDFPPKIIWEKLDMVKYDACNKNLLRSNIVRNLKRKIIITGNFFDDMEADISWLNYKNHDIILVFEYVKFPKNLPTITFRGTIHTLKFIGTTHKFEADEIMIISFIVVPLFKLTGQQIFTKKIVPQCTHHYRHASARMTMSLREWHNTKKQISTLVWVKAFFLTCYYVNKTTHELITDGIGGVM